MSSACCVNTSLAAFPSSSGGNASSAGASVGVLLGPSSRWYRANAPSVGVGHDSGGGAYGSESRSCAIPMEGHRQISMARTETSARVTASSFQLKRYASSEMRSIRFPIGSVISRCWPGSCRKRCGRSSSAFVDRPAVEEIDEHLAERGGAHHPFGEIVQHDDTGSRGGVVTHNPRSGLGGGALQVAACERQRMHLLVSWVRKDRIKCFV